MASKGLKKERIFFKTFLTTNYRRDKLILIAQERLSCRNKITCETY